jgi:chemosensory pili system protein ChpA (sensor histidine kinase/response regulator)
LLRLVGETITTNAQTQERLRLSLKQAQAVKAQNRLLHQLVSELDGLVDIHGAASPVRRPQGHEDFDALEMEQYSELHTLKNRLVEAVTDVTEITAQSEEQLSALGEVLETQSRLQLESQEAVMRTRMVRVETIVSRLQRGVRQAARLLDKNVTLTVKGTDTLIDGGVLNELIDPLMHVLRNAVDHGIEDAETRLANGKEQSGHIELSFVREGNAIVMRCRDDGRGLDIAAIKSRAMERGLIDGAQTPSDDDVARLILIPGFSTRNETTQVSGRGIGMDIVNKRIEDLKGSLMLHSDAGRGLNLEMRIPLSMLSTHALLVRVKDHMVALSTRNIEDIHYVTPGEIRQVGILRHYQVNGVAHDVVRLDALLNMPGDRRAHERTGFPVLLVRQNNGVIRAIEVQEIVDSRNLVMKNLGVYVPAIKGVAGAAILGDGSVVAVVDLPDLLRADVPMPPHAGDDEIDGHGQAVPRDTVGYQTALVVDDSLSARRATAQVMKDAGYVVRTAIDGMDAVSILEKFVPDIILADMEMPRMNGLELTSHVRGKSSTRDVPVIMITSRSTDKHRKQAQAAGVSVYLTKPFNDEVLLRHVSELGLEVVS